MEEGRRVRRCVRGLAIQYANKHVSHVQPVAILAQYMILNLIMILNFVRVLNRTIAVGALSYEWLQAVLPI